MSMITENTIVVRTKDIDKMKQAFYDLGAAKEVKFGDADCILCDAKGIFEVCSKLFAIEENCVIAGNPAKIVKRNLEWNRMRPNDYVKKTFGQRDSVL